MQALSDANEAHTVRARCYLSEEQQPLKIHAFNYYPVGVFNFDTYPAASQAGLMPATFSLSNHRLYSPLHVVVEEANPSGEAIRRARVRERRAGRSCMQNRPPCLDFDTFKTVCVSI